jgi:hypothetical protein|tara:strand:+ start:397 stop:822 length:426 start_codon:yes stop_codon:yes gene_type:complete
MATIKQKKAIKKIVENGGNISKAMRDVGYSEETAKTPQKLTNSKGWNELMEEYLPDDVLAKVHNEGLKAFKTDNDGGKSEDHPTRHKYLDTAYKLKGNYAPEKQAISLEIDESLNEEEAKDYEKWREQRLFEGSKQESPKD